VTLRALATLLAKDLRLIARDRVGLVFLTVAPIVVITVAGLSLASLYGADPYGQTAYVLPVVDEDGGPIGEAIRSRLATEASVTLHAFARRSDAIALLERRKAGVALVIPAGTSRAQEEGREARLLLLTDPVKYLETANVRALVQELRHRIEVEAGRRAAERFAQARREAEQRRLDFETALEQSRKALATFEANLASVRREIARRTRAANERARTEISERAQREQVERRRHIERALALELAPVRSFLAELSGRQRAFEAWLAAARERAGAFADRLPPPPPAPEVPAELTRLATSTPAELVERLVGGAGDSVEVSDLPAIDLPTIDLPAIAPFPKIDLPAPLSVALEALPGGLEIEERSVTGAPQRLNTFDQNVPGFSVTFLLLGMLLGVALGLLDERDWGTLERLRSMPTTVAAVLVAKLLSRVAVGLVQMLLLFAVGWAAFDISLGPQPWALLLPTAGIVFAGAAFGMVVAGCASSREAVLPIGSMAIVTMAAVGGCWWPIDLEPQWMRSVALALPTTWAMSAYNDLMIRRQGVVAVLWPTTVLFAHGGIYLTAGLFLLRRQLRRAG
jgi:ABC-type multidrug transport system permease subunit